MVLMPLFPVKEKRRGYNQATVLSKGMAEVLNIELPDHVVIRPQHTDTQTMKGRLERWENMEGKFILSKPK